MTVRVAVIGPGRMGQRHLQAIGSMPGSLVTGVFGASDLGSPPTPSQLQHDVLSVAADYCVLSVPPAVQPEIAYALAEAAIPTLLEKPLALDAKRAGLIRAAFDRAGVAAAVGHVEAHSDVVRVAATLIREGLVGETLSITSVRVGPASPDTAPAPAEHDLATHDFVNAMRLAGSPYAGISGARVRSDPSSGGRQVALAGRLQDGTLCTHIVGRSIGVKKRLTRVRGTSGQLTLDTVAGSLVVRTAKPDGGMDASRAVPLTRADSLTREHEAFLALMRGQDSESVRLSEGEQAVAMADAAVALMAGAR